MSSRPIPVFLLLFFVASMCLSVLPAEAWEGTVVRVVDGDTLIITPVNMALHERLDVSVRLYGIDAPEMNQPGGSESKAALERLVAPGDLVQVLTMESDRYDRLVGVVARHGMILNVQQIRSGNARVDEKYCRARFCGEWKQAAKKEGKAP